MSCPFNKESLDKLKSFIVLCQQNPSIIHLPELKFFKDYLESLDADIPEAMSEKTETRAEPEQPAAPVEEEMGSDAESELEFDMEGYIEPDVLSEEQEMGDAAKKVTEEENDQADEKRIAAMGEFSEGNFAKSVELLNEAIVLNPTSAVLFVKRGQSYLKLNKPNACIKDCTYALELNPDSAAGYKFRGRAYRLLADWEKAAKDLRQACLIDFDEQTDEWLKEVTPNAQRIEQHRLKQERKKTEKELKERTERVRKAKEAHAKASEAANDDSAPNSDSAGATGMGDFYKLMQDPEIMTALQDPEVAAAFQDISMHPANFMKYQNNPKVMALVSKLSSKLQTSGMGFPGGMGGFPGNFPGGGGFGAGGFGTAGGQATPSEDDGLD